MHKTMLLITDASLDDSPNVIYTCLHPIIIGKTGVFRGYTFFSYFCSKILIVGTR